MSIAERLAGVRRRMAAAATAAGRDPAGIELVVVTKRRTAAEVAAALDAGATRLGENYVQEARRKASEVRALRPDAAPRWHLIGPVQTNKAKYVAGLFDTVESVDRLELVEALDRRLTDRAEPLPVLVQVNVGREAHKAGVEPEGVEALLAAIAARSTLRPAGLMVIPPAGPDPDAARPHFRALAEQAAQLVARGALPACPVLSMGMSRDFEVAIAEGATRIRVGTAIFGTREAVLP